MSKSERQHSEQELAILVGGLDSSSKAVVRDTADKIVAAAAGGDRRVVDRVREALAHGRGRTRWGAAYALGRIPGALDCAALEALFEALASGDGDVRWAAAELIVRFGRAQGEVVQRRVLDGQTRRSVDSHKMALYIARDLEFKDPQTLAFAESSLRSEAVGVRLAALSLLSGFAPPTEPPITSVIRCLQDDPEMGVRRAAAMVLGRWAGSSEAARQALVQAGRIESDQSLLRAAAQSLSKLGPKR
ncbi:MAG TPA: HEAT repeat domain-containing protein [Candidatus Binataceae bacterium]|jgi:HEAT repeat protein